MDLFEPVALDTDVVSFILNGDPVRSPRYGRYLLRPTVYLPFTVVAELYYGAERRRWSPARLARLEDFVQQCVVIDSAPDIVRNWARIRAESERVGWTMGHHDSWIAAVAVTLDIPLVTHNASDFAHVPLLNIMTEPDP